MDEELFTVSVLIVESHVIQGEVFLLSPRFITEVRDVGAGIYREVELATSERGLVIYTKELEAELIRLGISN